MPNQSTYIVTGMTCGSCAGKVTDAVERIPGITDVDIDLSTGGITLSGEEPINDHAVKDAVEGAGYQLAAN